MGEIRIPVSVVMLVLLGAVMAAIGAQWPEIQRYLKVKAM
jgi:hypothetical protein